MTEHTRSFAEQMLPRAGGLAWTETARPALNSVTFHHRMTVWAGKIILPIIHIDLMAAAAKWNAFSPAPYEPPGSDTTRSHFLFLELRERFEQEQGRTGSRGVEKRIHGKLVGETFPWLSAPPLSFPNQSITIRWSRTTSCSFKCSCWLISASRIVRLLFNARRSSLK